MSDLISRESLKQRININYNNHQHIDAQSIKDIINAEPTVEDKTIEELKKIKAEIECNMRKNNCDLYGYADSLVIIDRHIAELKGDKE